MAKFEKKQPNRGSGGQQRTYNKPTLGDFQKSHIIVLIVSAFFSFWAILIAVFVSEGDIDELLGLGLVFLCSLVAIGIVYVTPNSLYRDVEDYYNQMHNTTLMVAGKVEFMEQKLLETEEKYEKLLLENIELKTKINVQQG